MSRVEHHAARMARARTSLEGLSLGDAFGERFFVSPSTVEGLIAQRAMPAAPWRCTDDTVMALSIVDVLEEHGGIDQERLAHHFGRRYLADRHRGYGPTAHDILLAIAQGEPWQRAAGDVFDGTGSMGNGGAMRVAPVGAYFENDPARAASEAAASAEVTHTHAEGQAGAIAVAVAASLIDAASSPAELFSAVLARTPAGETRDGITRASSLPLDHDVGTAVAALGNGSRVISQDTVPFALWCLGKCFGDFAEAMWTTVSGLGDRDTTCAIVGGILVLRRAALPFPDDWVAAREPLDRLPGVA